MSPEQTLDEIGEIERASQRIRSVASVLSKVFLAMFLIGCALALVLVVLAFGKGIEIFAIMNLGSALDFGKLLLELGLTLFMLWIPTSIFRDISLGVSPFTKSQAKRLKLAAILFLLHTLLLALASPAILNIAGLEGATIGFSMASNPSEMMSRVIPINVGDIVLAIVLFCAALIVEYGSLLQKLSDDTL